MRYVSIGVLLMLAAWGLWKFSDAPSVVPPVTPGPVVPAPPDKPCPDEKPWGPRRAPVGAEPADPRLVLDIPADKRRWYSNPDGSCVQCSIGMCGLDQNYPVASTLLWDSDWGKAERGGSYPGRVASYAEKRGMRLYNITGDDVYLWMRWCMKTGRTCAIGAGSSHFQTLAGWDEKTDTYFVVNNNSTSKVDKYSWPEFKRLHESSGKWIVAIDAPPHPLRPQYVKWWENN